MDEHVTDLTEWRAVHMAELRAAHLADLVRLTAQLGLPAPGALPDLALAAGPVVWRGGVALWMIDEGDGADASDSGDVDSVLYMYGADGVTRVRPLDINVRVVSSLVHSDQLFALTNTEEVYVWRSLHDVHRCFSTVCWVTLMPLGPCDCARANSLFDVTTRTFKFSDICVLGVDPCECADTSASMWRYRHLPELPSSSDHRYVLALHGRLLWDGHDRRSFDTPNNELRAIRPGTLTLAPAWAPERHHHHHMHVRALVLALLVVGRWAPRVNAVGITVSARMPPALWRRLLARTADRASADLRAVARRDGAGL